MSEILDDSVAKIKLVHRNGVLVPRLTVKLNGLEVLPRDMAFQILESSLTKALDSYVKNDSFKAPVEVFSVCQSHSQRARAIAETIIYHVGLSEKTLLLYLDFLNGLDYNAAKCLLIESVLVYFFPRLVTIEDNKDAAEQYVKLVASLKDCKDLVMQALLNAASTLRDNSVEILTQVPVNFNLASLLRKILGVIIVIRGLQAANKMLSISMIAKNLRVLLKVKAIREKLTDLTIHLSGDIRDKVQMAAVCLDYSQVVFDQFYSLPGCGKDSFNLSDIKHILAQMTLAELQTIHNRIAELLADKKLTSLFATGDDNELLAEYQGVLSFIQIQLSPNDHPQDATELERRIISALILLMFLWKLRQVILGVADCDGNRVLLDSVLEARDSRVESVNEQVLVLLGTIIAFVGEKRLTMPQSSSRDVGAVLLQFLKEMGSVFLAEFIRYQLPKLQTALTTQSSGNVMPIVAAVINNAIDANMPLIQSQLSPNVTPVVAVTPRRVGPPRHVSISSSSRFQGHR